MSLSTQRSSYLLHAWTSRRATPDEVGELFDWLKQQSHYSSISEYVSSLEAHYRENNINELVPAVDWEALYSHIVANREGEALPKSMAQLEDPLLQERTDMFAHRVHFIRTRFFRYAAAIILLIAGVTTAVILSSDRQSNKSGTDIAKKVVSTDIAPGGERAILTLGDGTSITLDNAANGAIAQQGNAQVVKLASGKIVYNLNGLSKGDLMMNTMRTPRGGQYQLTLPDGTKVWLNAASSITFPAVFVGDARNVKVSGEAYFEVAKNKEKPFIVDVDGKSSVEVLGTSFNVNAYEDESVLKTTLIDGSVKVNANAKVVILKPGQQAEVPEGNSKKIEVQSTVDISQVMAWKNGVFNFERTDLQAVLRQLARWYDLTIQYEGNPPVKYFQGEMERNLTLKQVIEVLMRVQPNMEFKLNGKTLIVKGN